MKPSIPVASVDLSGNEERYAVEAIRSTWISSAGAFLQRFECEFAQACMVQHALAVANGTVALHLVLAALNLNPGDEVIVPSMTYIATGNAPRYVGAEPVFVDVDPDTWTLNPDKIEEAISPRTKAIIPVHLLGHPADMDAINRIAATHGLTVIEDAAEATFASYKGKTVGGLGRVATFSFFGNKLLTCGEGGAVTTNDDQLAARLRILRGQGMDPNRRYYFPVTGYNFRLTNVAAAILCGQMERREEIVQARRRIYARYNQLLQQVPGVTLQPIAPWADLSPWMYACLIDENTFGCSRDEVMKHLASVGIETRPMFIPLHRLPPFRNQSRSRGEYLPVTDRLGEQGIMLPTYNTLTYADIDRVVNALAEAATTSSRRKAA
ncbi:MAG: DegT/DnrJ/EryC1/StrS family aminotransferase [Gemmataceae bacterium]